MKKIIVILIVGVVLFGAFSAQKADAQSANITQKIIGTWISSRVILLGPSTNYLSEVTWVFNSNGTLTVETTNEKSEDKFIIVDSKLVTQNKDKPYSSPTIYDILISSDGRNLILTYMSNGNSGCVWLIKK